MACFLSIFSIFERHCHGSTKHAAPANKYNGYRAQFRKFLHAILSQYIYMYYNRGRVKTHASHDLGAVTNVRFLVL